MEVQPVHSHSGNRVLWDGRLDNRDELLLAMDRRSADLPTDAELAAAAFDHWGAECFQRLNGDWAMAVWDRRRRRVILARDYIGIRKLFYLRTPKSLFWSTNLTTLVLHSGEEFTLCNEYFAGYFVSHPEPQLTPYAEIKAVPPGAYVEATTERIHVRRYWSFAHLKPICYKTDANYEEEFRTRLFLSLRRRMRTDYPILADLSGGLDSSSLVCMAYELLKRGEAKATINTLSYYSLDEPSGDERPYFHAVETHIGKVGTHLKTANGGSGLKPLRNGYFTPLPGYFDNAIDGGRRLADAIAGQGNRVHLAGLGGDELLGGVQNPVPQLASLLWTLQLSKYWTQLQAWSLQRKIPLWTLLGQSILALMPLGIRARIDTAAKVPSWLRVDFADCYKARQRKILAVSTWRDHLFGPSSYDSTYLTLASTLQSGVLSFTGVARQVALPFYDRDLFSFLFAIPEEQLLRVNQRRSLMRRALKDIVPEKVLLRKTKWLGRREAALELINVSSDLETLLPMTLIGQNYIDLDSVLEDIEKLRQGNEVPVVLLYGLVGACQWLMQPQMPLRTRGQQQTRHAPRSCEA